MPDSCAHFQQVGPSSYITHIATIGPWNCPWCEIARLRQYEPLKGGVPVREWTLKENLKLAEEGLANYEEENQRLMAVLRDITSAYERRTELFTNDADCAANLYDRARGAEPQDGKHPPGGRQATPK